VRTGRRWPATLGLAAVLAIAPPGWSQPAGQGARPSLDQDYGCVVCHADMRRAFIQGVHAERGIVCDDCHGGDPTALDTRPAHSGDFIGSPDKRETVALCASCHSSPDLMRQYGLPAGQLAEFRTSRHGQLLEAGDTNAPSCVDCHDSHRIYPPGDARSTVYPTNIPGTCGRCHRDAEMMTEYGVSAEVIDRYLESAHAAQLFGKQNFAAPSCVGCHGAHSALPPRISEIANVCGRCHLLVQSAFESGPHGAAAARGVPFGCTACHSNHGTERTSAEAIQETCARCHAEGSAPAVLGADIEARITHANDDIQRADSAIQQLVRDGRDVTDARFRYQSALTEYSQLAHVQHSLDTERLEDLTLRVSSISRDIRGAAEASAERRWEHKLFLVPIWFLALAAIFLAGLKLRNLS
jgi:hypothetical protein